MNKNDDMTIRKTFFFLCLSAVLLFSCGKPETGGEGNTEEPSAPGQQEGIKPGDPVQVVDGKVRFYLDFKEDGIFRTLGVKADLAKDYTLAVGGKEYEVTSDEEGRAFAEVAVNPAAFYNASVVSEASGPYFGSSPYIGLILPPGQFRSSATDDASSMPLFASYAKENGNVLYLSPGCGMLSLDINGASKLVSVKVEDPAGTFISGYGNYVVSKQANIISKGFPWVSLNCTGASGGGKFFILVAAGEYPLGLDVTVSDAAHRKQTHHLDLPSLQADQVFSQSFDWQPEEDVIFYEGFDNCVWGGDVVSGSNGVGFAPVDKDPGTDADATLRGNERALATVPYNQPGTGYIQPAVFMDVSGRTVEQAHKMSSAYVASRNFGGYRFLYRCQEHPGYVALGTGDDYRGIWQTVPLKDEIGGLCDLSFSFDFVLAPGFKDLLHVQVVNGGFVESVQVDGEHLENFGQGTGYIGVTHTINLAPARYATGSMASKKTWHHAEIKIRNANDATYFSVTTADEGKGVHGFWLDNLLVRRTKDRRTRDNGTFRVLYWNIQDGMWADQYNNYDNFVAWIKRYSPDVCVWCEARSIFNAAGTYLTKAEKATMLTNAWPSLYPRYNHSYYALGGDRNNYPQAITSRYSITTLKRITDTDEAGRPVVSGAGLFRINVAGEDIYIVTLHPYAQAYAADVPVDERDASAAAHGGDYYREHEVKYVISQTINNPEYAGVKNWIMMGDFNSQSPNDDFYYKLGASTTKYLAQKQILDNTEYRDIIAEQYPGAFMTSTCSATSRVDYMFASEQMYGRVANAVILTDSWADPYQVDGVAGYLCYPSDHRPVMVDFRMK